MKAKPHAALIIVGHGSTLNPDSSSPTYEHAERIRQTGLFAEVACCFWKEEPNMREVFEMVESDTLYIVPNFISEGYFCQQVLPRELRLDGPVTRRGRKTIYYCAPVGVHANMMDLLLQRAAEITPGVSPSETSLIIVGHGTSLNENSTQAIKEQVRLIGEGDRGFAEVLDAYMEEAPLVADWHQLSRSPNVVVVPFFIADGLHSYQDIPVLLGIMEETGAALSEGGGFGINPHTLRGRQLYYSGAIGTEPLMANVILDQVSDFDLRHGIEDSTESLAVPPSKIEAALSKWLAHGEGQIGEVYIRRKGEGFQLCHAQDKARLASDDLAIHTGPEQARLIARHTDAGKFRALHSAPTLKHGWRLDLASVAELRLALDYFHPAAIGAWLRHRDGELDAEPLRGLLGRQTGMYRFANGIEDEQAHTMVGDVCSSSNCLRRIVWPLAADQPLAGDAACKAKPEAGFSAAVATDNRIPLFCIEACPYIVGAARKIARANFESRNPPPEPASSPG